METQTVQSFGAALAAGSRLIQNPRAILGKDEFLKLLVTQLRNQDPLNPLDQNEFMGQTAQFAALEQLQSINAGLKDLAAVSAGSSLTQAAALLGKTAEVSGSDFEFDGVAAELPFALDGGGGLVTVKVLDREGNVLRQIDVGPRDAGEGVVTWDGLDSQGRPVAPGPYFYHVEAVGLGGPAPAAVAATGVLSGLEREGSQVFFRLGDRLVRLEDVLSVGEQAAEATE